MQWLIYVVAIMQKSLPKVLKFGKFLLYSTYVKDDFNANNVDQVCQKEALHMHNFQSQFFSLRHNNGLTVHMYTIAKSSTVYFY